MSVADYRLCDKCGNKTFYDVELDYQVSREVKDSLNVPCKENNKSTTYNLGNLGNWAVLCLECSKLFEFQIVRKS